MTTEQIAKLVEQAVMRERRRCATWAAEMHGRANELEQASARSVSGGEDAARYGGMAWCASYLETQIKSGAMPHEAK